jgi:nucleotide sugar dehydrogenase
MHKYAKLLSNRDYKIGVWGAGYIGYSTMAYFARRGVATLATDVSPARVDAVNRANMEVIGLKDWLGFDVSGPTEDGLLKATLNHEELLNGQVLVHFIAIPTEKDGKPYNVYLEDVIGKLAGMKVKDPDLPPLVIIESTLTPGTTDKVVIPIFERHKKEIGKDILLGIAPRRDWFVDGTRSLKELDRVFGGCDQNTTETMRDVLGIVCDVLHAASSYRSVEIVKSCENAYRHMEITLANQISLAYPSVDVREVLRLVGTKWNIGTFFPGFGTGGYCIPLSSQYVLAGAERPEELSILTETVRTDTEINRRIARSIIERGFKNVGVLGLSYKADLKVWILSPTLPFIQELKAHNVNVKLCDPFYSTEEVSRIAGVEAFDFPQGLRPFDAVVAVVDHHQFRTLSSETMNCFDRCRFILDNTGMWQSERTSFEKRGIEYHVAGDAHWLGGI